MPVKKAKKSKPDFRVLVEVTYRGVHLTVDKLTKWTDWDGKVVEDYESIWTVDSTTEDTCCGFPQLTAFEDPYDGDKKLLLEKAPELGKMFGEKLKEKIGYVCAYVPNMKGYDVARAVFAAAGFKPTVTLKSAHGRYTNTRWDFFGNKYKEDEHEKVVRACNL